MLNGREKNGDLNIDWKEYALGANHFKRKTVGFGKYDKKEREYQKELYIREMSIIQGGIGCAIWDAAIILSRWIYAHPEAFTNKSVLELGSGVGLPGILSSYYANDVTLTDYLEPLIDNLKYNVDLNARQGLDIDSDQEDEETISNLIKSDPQNIKNKIKIQYLNWDDIEKLENTQQYDIIFGSELTYSLLSVDNLIKVIQKFLKPNGIFYEILSDDRDGVSYFVEEMNKKGFIGHIVPVPAQYLGNYGTKQRAETYKFYTFRFNNNEINNHPNLEN
ncbi:hypothetical protein DLAC_07875 [Tieghemostelium lacteum]|uniref:Methyltransferase type 12 domain-containing protein n=1 Tax=Tieghemostelium lacteum TaxID=361077 RepID=A0A151ZAM5_TIELA|nr:hypothetical protein DLAC_07875 [Tieghemostelium lacteum]|eukprot:KYQ90986.1 hypothetical protein DLAC_07875 [Tieghemostelium lacteum]